MSKRFLSHSLFRPVRGVDQSVLAENEPLVRSLERRLFLRQGLSLGALTLLTGCDISNKESVQAVLKGFSHWNDRVQAWLFDPTKLAPTFSEAEVMKPPRFNAFYSIDEVKPVDAATWKLEVGGLVKDKRPWTLDRINALPKVSQITRHVCVEGWDYIGKWSGVGLSRFLQTIEADLTAKYVAFECADDYSGSIDMASALHPQTQLTTHYADEPIGDPYGFPLRLRVATKLGFKMPKWITSIEVTNEYPGGYWEDRDYNWFSGL
jgi:DMSO/TMAO reductase YedYZ molybdopterin-dependent catalytic subunit